MQIQTTQKRVEVMSLNLKSVTTTTTKEVISPRVSSPRASHVTLSLPLAPTTDNKCVDDVGDENDSRFSESISRSRSRSYKNNNNKKKKEIPPPIPLLAWTQNINNNVHSHMPWVLKRYYTSDGRLVLKEEKVGHHQYFRAHRANGRLTLHLIPISTDSL